MENVDFENGSKIDVFRVLSSYGEVRANLNRDMVASLRRLVLQKFGSFMGCARKFGLKVVEKNDYNPLKTWLRENEKYRSAMPFPELIRLSADLGVDFNDVCAQIVSFQVWRGKTFLPPRHIEIDPEFVYGIGLYLGEGKNETNRRYRCAIANTDTDIVRFSIKWFEKYFSIDRKKIKLYVVTSNMENEENSRKELAEKFGMYPDNIRFYFNRLANFPVIEVVFDAKVVRLVIDWLKENLTQVIYLNDEFGKAYVQGIADAEAHIRPNKAELVIEMYNTKALDTVDIIYRKFGITPNREKDGSILLVEARDFFKLKDIVPFRLNKKRAEIFAKAVENIKQIQTKRNWGIVRCINFLSKNKGLFTTDAIAKGLGYKSSAHVSMTLNHMEKMGYVFKNNKRPFSFEISQQGRAFVEKLKNDEKSKVSKLFSNAGIADLKEADTEWVFN